jgi:muramoyltetrapeptide carboxypeptidase
VSHIYVFSPSSAVRDRAAMRRGVARLRALGHEVEIDPDALTSYMRFAGDDATRLAAIHRAAASGADIALITRGGYGLTRLLPDIRYKAVAKSIDKGLRFVGLSDFTAFQNALMAQTGAVSWSGPALGEDFGVEGEPDEIMGACFDDLAGGAGEGTGWRLPVAEARERSFKAQGPLWGGNLSVLVSLVGTPWLPQAQGGILFLEDVNESAYRIERMLYQLFHSGILQRQRAILLGSFEPVPAMANDDGYGLDSVVEHFRARLDVPVLRGLPFGHVARKATLPVGAPAALSVARGTARLSFQRYPNLARRRIAAR